MLIFVYFGVSSLITYVLYRKGKFKNVDKSKNLIITALGFILPFVDIIETWIGFEYEGNPLLLLIPEEYMWPIFISSHIAFSFVMLCIGKKGMAEVNANHRVFLTLITFCLLLLTVMNVVLYIIHLSL